MSPLIYFHAAETAKGRRDYLSSQLQGIDKIVEVNEPTRYETSRMLEEILLMWEKDYQESNPSLRNTPPIECLLDPLNPRLKLAVINREKKVACVTPVRLITEELREDYYHALKTALSLHDALEAIYIDVTDFDKLSNFFNQFIKEHITDLATSSSLNRQPKTFHRFLGSITAYGTIDFIPKLTETIGHRFFIKGRAGTGKSTILKRIAQEAHAVGFDTEVYHCGFDPDSLDMVIIRALDLAVFDSTLPHEHFPNRKGDELIDFYGDFIPKTTDEDNQHDINKLNNLIGSEIKKAIKILQEDDQRKKTLENTQPATVLAFNQRLRHYIDKL